MTSTALLGGRRDRYGEPTDPDIDPDSDPVTDSRKAAGPMRCEFGAIVARDMTCCLRHDRSAALARR